MIRVGTAGWSIPRRAARSFPGSGSHLERYARLMPCAEINTSFYRNHSFDTYRKWARLTPAGFRFAVKIPQTITHELGLRRARVPLRTFLAESAGLGKKRGPLLVQLPPSFEFDSRVARTFFTLFRQLHKGVIVCEPRHATWFTPKAEQMLVEYRIGRVAADPAKEPAAGKPGGYTRSIVYYRLHGSPDMYWSKYSSQRIKSWAEAFRREAAGANIWCMFDNTASGAAIENALDLQSRVTT
jgi:uncharacterized protein YecE (DUF72 family)